MVKDSADYITKLPKAEQNRPEWQTAIHCMIGTEGSYSPAEVGLKAKGR
jgi:hypothetical protein